MAIETDVLICGAGPVGLTLAAQLQACGVSCVQVDKAAGTTQLSKALVVWARSLELLDLCMESQDIVAAGLPVERAQFFAHNEPLASVDFRGADSRFGAGVMLPQSETERLLEQHLNSTGHVVRWNTELVGFKQHEQGVEGQLLLPDGSTEVVQAKWLVGCDGAHSIVRHTLDLPFHGEVDLHRWMVADVHAAGNLPEGQIVVCWHPVGVLILFQIAANRYRVIAELPLDNADEPRQDPTLEDIQSYIDERGPGGITVSDPVWLTEFRINERMVDRYCVGRAILAGDAAHVHSPAGGQGMNTGMQDAVNLAWKLAWMDRGVAGPSLLESYSVERNSIGEQVVRNASHITRVATLKSRGLQLVRNSLARVALHFQCPQDFARDTLSELTICYPDSPIAGEDTRRRGGKLRLGDRVPDVTWFDAGGAPQSLYRRLEGGRGAVVAWNASEPLAARMVAELPTEWQGMFAAIDLIDGEVPPAAGPSVGRATAEEIAHLGLTAPAVLIVRPDGYLAAAGDCSNADLLSAWVEKIGNRELAPSR